VVEPAHIVIQLLLRLAQFLRSGRYGESRNLLKSVLSRPTFNCILVFCMRKSSWNPSSVTMEHESPSACVIAQQYSSSTCVSLPFLSCMEQYGALLQKYFCILLNIACLKLRQPCSVLLSYCGLRISQFARNWQGIKQLLLTLLYKVLPFWVLLNISDIPVVDQINILFAP
jgi:hypothetical protein